jgi:hypothetical protein
MVNDEPRLSSGLPVFGLPDSSANLKSEIPASLFDNSTHAGLLFVNKRLVQVSGRRTTFQTSGRHRQVAGAALAVITAGIDS